MSAEGERHLGKEELSHSCIFCGIIEGKVESSRILETKNSVAFMSIEGHTIVIPKKHIGKEELDIVENMKLFNDALTTATALIKSTVEALGATGLNLAVNIGEDAGQRVDHMHIHLINRNKGDGKVEMSNMPSMLKEELDSRAKKITLAFNRK